MAEIEAMSQMEPVATETPAAPESATESEPTEVAAIVVGIDPALYPKAPKKKREQKQRLLSDDSAAVGMSG